MTYPTGQLHTGTYTQPYAQPHMPPIIINNNASSSAAAAFAGHGHRRRFRHTRHLWLGLFTGGLWWFTGYPWCYSRWRRGL